MALEKFKKLLKDKKALSKDEVGVKKGIVGHIKKAAEDMMKDDMHGFKKVTVAAPDNESLKEGLDVAKEVADKGLPIGDFDEGSKEEEESESPAEEKEEEKNPEMESSESNLHKMEEEIHSLSSEKLEELKRKIEEQLAKK